MQATGIRQAFWMIPRPWFHYLTPTWGDFAQQVARDGADDAAAQNLAVAVDFKIQTSPH
jgi:hypothetical protein